MTFREMLAADMQSMMDTDVWGESVAYVEGTQETTLSAVLFGERVETPESNGITTKKRIREITFATADLPTYSLRGSIRLGTVDWSIESVAFKDDVQTTLVIVRNELHDATRPGYRRK